MVIGDTTYSIEAPEVVFVGIVSAVPSHNVKRCMVLCCGEEVAGKLGQNAVCECGRRSGRVIFDEGRDGGLKISSVGETIRANWAELWKMKVTLIQLENVPTDWTRGQEDIVAYSTRNNAYFVRANKDGAQLCTNI